VLFTARKGGWLLTIQMALSALLIRVVACIRDA
jgi:hypothetical protein